MDIAKVVLMGLMLFVLVAIAHRLKTLDEKERTLTLKPTNMLCQFLNSKTFMCVPMPDEEASTPKDAKSTEKKP